MKTTGQIFSNRAISTRTLRQRAYNLRWAGQDPDVIPLTAADSDFPVSQAIIDALSEYMQGGIFSYTPPEGLPEFREAVATWFSEHKGLSCGPEHVLATDGAASTLQVVAFSFVSPGDEILIFDPVDFLFQTTVERAGGCTVRVALTVDMPIELLLAELDSALTKRTTMLWLCNPHNPLGRVFSADELLALGNWALEKGVSIVSDEIWSDIVYAPYRHTCMASLSPEIAQITLTVYGFSKNFGLAGMRMGALITHNASWMERVIQMSGARETLFGSCVLSQIAAIAAMEHAVDWLSAFVQHLQRQRDLVFQRIYCWPGFELDLPQGTFVAFPKLPAGDISEDVFCSEILKKARVALVPGSPRWFGPGARHHVRISFATSEEILTQALDRIETVLPSLF